MATLVDDCFILGALSVVLFCMWAAGLVARHVERSRHNSERARILEINRDMTDRLWRLASNRDALAESGEETRAMLQTMNANLVALGRLVKRARS